MERLINTHKKLAALIAKQSPSPTAATTIPPSEGPTARAVLNAAEFKATALSRSLRSAMWISNDWRAGTSKAFTMPKKVARTSTCQTWTTPVKVSTAKTDACTRKSVWVMRTTLLRSNLSAAKPPAKPNNKTGKCVANEARPRISSDFVSLYSNQLCAMLWIHVPERETNWPARKTRKFRCLNAAKELILSSRASEVGWFTSFKHTLFRFVHSL